MPVRLRVPAAVTVILFTCTAVAALQEQRVTEPSVDAESLTRLDVARTFEVYDGDHGNRIRERFESQVLRFFSQHLIAR